MIKLRTTTGRSYSLSKDVRFVELRDGEENIALLIYLDDAGVVHVVEPGSPEMKNYLNLPVLKGIGQSEIRDYIRVKKDSDNPQ